MSKLRTWLLVALTAITLQSAYGYEVNPVNDVTDSEFNVAWNSIDSYYDAELILRLQQYKIIFVPGFFANHIIDVGQALGGARYRIGEYFDEQMKFLKNEGIECERLRVNSEAEAELNAPLVAAAIRSADKPVLIISHSKGGLDTLEALIRDTSLLAKVKGWVPMQAPFEGTPVADFVDSNEVLNPIAITLLQALGGTKNVLHSLRQTTRDEYLERNSNAIQMILNKVPTLSFSSWKASGSNPFDTPFAPIRDAMEYYGISNDGLVPWESQILRGSSYVGVPDVDHLIPVMYSYFGPYNRILLIRTLLAVLDEHMGSRDAQQK